MTKRAATLAARYLLGGVGAFNVKSDLGGSPTSSETKFAWNGGAGASFGVGGARLFVESRYISVSTTGQRTNFVPVTAGITFRTL